MINDISGDSNELASRFFGLDERNEGNIVDWESAFKKALWAFDRMRREVILLQAERDRYIHEMYRINLLSFPFDNCEEESR